MPGCIYKVPFAGSFVESKSVFEECTIAASIRTRMGFKTLAAQVFFVLMVAVMVAEGKKVPVYLPAPKKCGRNEFYKACVSSNCAENLCGESSFKACVEDCVSGCYCAHDHYRNRLGLCVTDCSKDDGGYFQRPGLVLPWKPQTTSKNYFILGSYHLPIGPAG
nr:uncharacterized protein LOC126525645 isoform X1 [Dermacentor andersoni]